MPTHDSDIRPIVRDQYLSEYRRDEGSDIVGEFHLCRSRARIDLAVLNGQFLGFEIKSGADTLRRLPRQIEYFDKVFNELTLFVSERHLPAALDEVPDHWGLVTFPESDPSALELDREPSDNPNQKPKDVASLLWKWELLDELERRGIDWGVRSKTRKAMCQRLAENVPLPEVRNIVLRRLKSRENWRSD